MASKHIKVNERSQPMVEKRSLREEILSLLPGYNCGICGYARCDEFTAALIGGHVSLENCRFLYQEIFTENLEKLQKLLKKEEIIPEERRIIGLLDNYEADFILKPFPGESSCREILYPFTDEKLEKGEIIRYRPLGCPITHFAEIINKNHGLITVHIIGPCHRLGKEFDFREIGVCLVGGFEGIVDGELPSVGETVRFLPHHCMMQKVHSGVIVQIEGEKVLIEIIDLKVWTPPIKAKRQ